MISLFFEETPDGWITTCDLGDGAGVSVLADFTPNTLYHILAQSRRGDGSIEVRFRLHGKLLRAYTLTHDFDDTTVKELSGS